MYKIEYDIEYGDVRPVIKLKNDLSNDDSFLIYELAGLLINDLYWRESNNIESTLTEDAIKQIQLTASTLKTISDLTAKLLLGGQNNINEANDILNKDSKNKEDEF